jgi:predicted CoA-binding protein
MTPPRSIAVIGASADRGKFGNKCVRAYRQVGWQVFPVHPSAAQIEGLTAYPTLLDVPPIQLERVSVYLPASVMFNVLDTMTGRPIGELWLNPGADSPHIAAKASQMGFNVICGCSIVDIGISPHDLD